MKRLGPAAQVAMFNALGAGLGFVVLMLLTRGLGPEAFGRLSPALAVMDLGPLLIDTVLAVGTVTVAARSLARDPAEGRDAAATALALRGGVALCYAACVVAFVLLVQVTDPGLIAMAGLAGGLLALQTALIGGLQVERRFLAVGAAQAMKNLTRAAAIGAVMALAALTVTTAVQASLLAAALAAGITLVIARPRRQIGRPRQALMRQMLAINLWMAVAAISVVSGRIDVLLLSSLSGPVEAGYYAASMQLCIVVGVFSQAIVTTALPQVAAIARLEELRAVLKGWLRRAPLALLPVLVLPLLSPVLVPLVLGPGFADAHPVLDILFAASMLTLVANPVLMLLFPLGAARVFGLAALAQVVVKLAIAVPLMPHWGAAGVAAVDLVTRLVMAGIILAVLRRKLAQDGPINPALTEAPT